MKRIFSTLLVLASAAGLAQAARAADTGEKTRVGDVTQGARLFAVHCASCHGALGKGGGAVKTVPPAPSLDDPAQMTLMSDRQVFELIKGGGPALGKAETMPAFGDALDPLQMWDLVAFLRSRHLEIGDFFANAESYFGEPYTIDKWGAERHFKLTHVKLPKDDRTYTVLGIYKGTPGPEGPRLIPNTPLAVSQIDRQSKIGYVVFVDAKVPGVKGSHLLGISMDKGGLVWAIKVNTDDLKVKKQIESLLASWEGYGYKGMKEPFEGGRSRKERALAKAWTEIYSRAMEAVVMFDKAERERHWADEDFGGPKEPDASVEGGELQIIKNKKKKGRR